MTPSPQVTPAPRQGSDVPAAAGAVTPLPGPVVAVPAQEPTEGASAQRSALPGVVVLLVGFASGFLILAGLYFTAWLVAPVFLALMIVIAISPVQSYLLRHGWPAWLATLVLVLAVVALLLVFAVVIIVSIARLAELLPQYSDRADDLLQSLAGSLQQFGVDPASLQAAVSSVNPTKLVALIGAVLAGISGAMSSLVFLLCLLLFLSVEAGGMEQRLGAIAGDRPSLERALRSFAAGTRSYLVVTTVFGLIVGVLDAGALALIGVPLPVLWGLLSFLTNFIPNIGFVIGLVPPALLALLEGGVPMMLTVIAVYCVLNFVIQSLIQPRFVGDSVGLSMTMTFLALLFWAWLLGPLGALLAIPMTLLFKALLVDVNPSGRWAIALAGSLAATDDRPEPHSDGEEGSDDGSDDASEEAAAAVETRPSEEAPARTPDADRSAIS
jgi:AI-2 transport protein TqsA